MGGQSGGGKKVAESWRIISGQACSWLAGLHVILGAPNPGAAVHDCPRCPTWFSSRAHSCWFSMRCSKEPTFLFSFSVSID